MNDALTMPTLPGIRIRRSEGGAPISQADDNRAILDDFRRGQPEAVGAVRGWIRAVVFGGRWGFEDPDAVCQDILIDVLILVRRNGVRGPGAFQKLVHTLARCRAVDRYHSTRKRASIEADVPDEELHAAPAGDVTASSALARRDRLNALRYVIQRLPEACRELWRMIYLEHRSAEAIGEALGSTANNVRVRTHRCLEKAREIKSDFDRDGAPGLAR